MARATFNFYTIVCQGMISFLSPGNTYQTTSVTSASQGPPEASKKSSPIFLIVQLTTKKLSFNIFILLALCNIKMVACYDRFITESHQKTCQHSFYSLNRKAQFLKNIQCKERLFMNKYISLQFNYVWMPKKLQILNLSADLPHNIKAAYLLSVQDLHCHFVPGQFMLAN